MATLLLVSVMIFLLVCTAGDAAADEEIAIPFVGQDNQPIIRHHCSIIANNEEPWIDWMPCGSSRGSSSAAALRSPPRTSACRAPRSPSDQGAGGAARRAAAAAHDARRHADPRRRGLLPALPRHSRRSRRSRRRVQRRCPKGTLRVDVQGTLARHFLMPGLPRFLAQYPDIELAMSESDRWVDLVREGVDCVLRFGELQDSDLVARTVAALERITFAAPPISRALAARKRLMISQATAPSGCARPRQARLRRSSSAAKESRPHGSRAAPLTVTSAESDLIAAARPRARSVAGIPRRARPRRRPAAAHVLAAASGAGRASLGALSAQPSAIASRAGLHRLDRATVFVARRN